ncbi:hypothetical protein ACHAWO_000357 [Cyclotella atomus]|uniref:Tim44-like domain-containing protein n=1 Tax=Cyclotella atomus TaxID=382360 RepID=A0ABD3PMY0_9STRA
MAARLSHLLHKTRNITRVHPRSFTSSTNSSDYYFPWRHSPNLPLRIAEKDDLSGMPNNFRARFVRRMIAGRELNLSLWDVLPLGFERGWEEELAGNFATAYGMALCELLKSVFGVPVNNDYVTISMDSSIKDLDVEQETNQMAATTKTDSTYQSEVGDNPMNVPLIDNEYLNSMLDKNLLARYQLVDRESIHVKLSIKPISAMVQHIFAIPLLTREIVEQKPHLKGGYLRIEKEFEDTKSYDKVREMTLALADEVGRDSFKRTVVAEAVIHCLEFFQVKDVATGEVVRGMIDGEEAEEVVHLVRFEVVTDKRDDGKGREVGNWKIIDWDDLLDGNRFH